MVGFQEVFVQETKKRYALISVTEKKGLIELATALVHSGVRLLSTGGTASLLREARLEVLDVATFTGSPEVFGGRVKTLHPKVHGGILYDRNNPEHLADAKKLGIEPIDFVVVNLYDFAGKARDAALPLDKAIDYIDIGGPAMLRAAAKNHRHTLPVVDPEDYGRLIEALTRGDIPLKMRSEFAGKTYAVTARYDSMIATYFAESQEPASTKAISPLSLAGCSLVTTLRYGENPHQRAALFVNEQAPKSGFAAAQILQGKELSYNNYLDLDAAAALVRDCTHPAVAIIKHTNPCGAATHPTRPLAEIYQNALASDPKSAFGGIVATNRPVDGATAQLLAEIFLECIVAPDFSREARDILTAKKNLRLVTGDMTRSDGSQARQQSIRSIAGALLVQDTDAALSDPGHWKTVTRRPPTPGEKADLIFAEVVCKHVKSNAIVYVKDLKTLAVGAGQMSRIDSAVFAAEKARERGLDLNRAVVASDAFFPFRDTVDLLARWGVTAVIQPGGSVRDDESIAAADEAGIAMVFTGMRHFRH